MYLLWEWRKNIFPSARSIESEADTEEERRLAYVALTRAKEQLYTHSCRRTYAVRKNGAQQNITFVKELPTENYVKKEEQGLTSALAQSSGGVQPTHSMTLQQQLAQKRAEKSAAVTETFEPGERVRHRIFGEGTVLTAKRMANDTLLEIAFESKGTKKIMANFAKIKKI